jgi:hypothetical protein
MKEKLIKWLEEHGHPIGSYRIKYQRKSVYESTI